MAEVDFSHAKIEPVAYSMNNNDPVNPTSKAYLALGGGGSAVNIWGLGTSIIGSANITRLVNDQKQFVIQYQGSFSTSGTEFYLIEYGNSVVGAWRVYNISFSSGDTFIFQIQADLICQ